MKIGIPFRSRRSFFRVAASAAVALVTAGGAHTAMAQAQSWPTKPIRVVVNFPPGGLADVMARLIAQPVSEALGQPMVIENRAGANGNIGAEAVATADPDGYTFLFSSGGMASVNPHLYSNMSFDPAKDLQEVAAAARVPVYLVTRLDVPVKTPQELIELAKKNPGKLSYASAGNGSSPHLAGEMFNSAAKIDTLHVPYRGAAPALVDLLAGQVDYMFTPGVGLVHVHDGKLRLLAVASLERSEVFPNTPTIAEGGLDGFDADTWFGFYAPAGTDAAIVKRMNEEVNRVLKTPEVRKRFTDLGVTASPMSSKEFTERARVDFDRFGEIIRARGISMK